tara:strand:+ start:89 stop:1201 length:1113 start_codon:yes stop_codon:yes gene_type:complete
LNYFKNIKLENYRNFNNLELDFDQNCNVFFGNNGSGKTNILESISLFERGRGFRQDKINNLINFESKKDNFRIYSNFFHKHGDIIVSVFNERKKISLTKKIIVNGSSSKDSKEHFESLFSIIYFLPEMERLFVSSPSARRNFLDRLIFNSNKRYLKIVNDYKKNITERSRILKDYNSEIEWLNNIEKKIVELGIIIYKERLTYIEEINLALKRLDIAKKFNYKININLDDLLLNQCKNDTNVLFEEYIKTIKASREIDKLLGGSKVGPHKSDIVGYDIGKNININQFSTGQQKTVVLLIILAQCTMLISEQKISPIILFDEVCSHLDNNNRELLLHIIKTLDVQTFLTGTEKSFFSFLSTKTLYCNINEL